MSDAASPDDYDDHDVHQSPIKTPKQLITVVILSFIVPIAIIGLLVKFVSFTPNAGEGSNAMSPEAVSARIAPVAQLVLVDANAPKVFKTGEGVYQETCATCHGAGIAGAPKFGDAALWAPRIKQGADTLFDHAIKGYTGKAGAMPAKGGNTELDDLEVERAVVYMANGSGGKLKEPPAPPAAAAAPAAEAAATAPASKGSAESNASASPASASTAASATAGMALAAGPTAAGPTASSGTTAK